MVLSEPREDRLFEVVCSFQQRLQLLVGYDSGNVIAVIAGLVPLVIEYPQPTDRFSIRSNRELQRF